MPNSINFGSNQFTTNKAQAIPTGGNVEYFFSLNATMFDPISDAHVRYFGTLNFIFTDYGTNHLPSLFVASDQPTELLTGPDVNSIQFYILNDLQNAQYTVSGQITEYINDEVYETYTDGFSFGPNGIIGRSVEFTISINTNLPIFGNSLEFINKTPYSDFYVLPSLPSVDKIENVFNWVQGGETDEPFKWYMQNTYTYGTGTYEGFERSGSTYTRYQDIYTPSNNDRVCLYYNSSDNSFNLLTGGATINQVYYGDGNGYYDNGTSIEYTKFYYTWKNQIGNLYSAIRFNTNIPMWESLSRAQDYINGTIDVNQAINFSEISNEIEPFNVTGAPEISTSFSDTYHTGVFGVQLACSISALRDICDVIYTDDNDIWENVKKGLEMYVNPIDSIYGLTYYPFDVSALCSGQSQNYVYFGSYRAELDHNVFRIIHSNGYIDCGSVDFRESYHNYIDMEHTSLEVYLPYIGYRTLKTSEYMGHTISVRYYIDFHTGGCTACILADGRLIDYFEGIIGSNIPITAINFHEYANQTINTLLGGVSQLTIPSIGGGVGGAIGGGVGLGLSIDKAIATTTYDIATNRAQDHAQTRGSLGADTGGHMPQYVIFKFIFEKPIEPKGLKALYGKPSNASGSISSFGGFLKCSIVDLECGRATDSEKDEIISLLKSGIRI